MKDSAIDALRRELAGSGSVFLSTGPGGGGDIFVRWLSEAFGWSLGTPGDDDAGRRWPGPGVTVLDTASTPVAGGPPERGLTISSNGTSATARVDAVAALLSTCAREALSMPRELADWLADRYGACTSVLDALAEADAAELLELPEPDRARATDALVRGGETFRRHLTTLHGRGGARLLDIARVVYLLWPQEMHLGDEWAELASAGSGRSYSLADVNRVLSEFPELFELSLANPLEPGVRPSNRFVNLLFSGFVPASNSEYYQLFRWMSRRAVDSLKRADGGDSYVRRNLPRIARRAGAMPELLENGTALLASDIDALTHALERSPELIVHPSAKAALLHAHRLRPDEPDRAAQMELALRRMSRTVEADQISEMFPDRPWRPVWSSTNPTHVHRILGEEQGGALCLAPVPDERVIGAYVGFANGVIHRLSDRGGPPRVLPSAGAAEIRDIATTRLGAHDYVCSASSDGAVHAYRVESDPTATGAAEVLWADRSTHRSPLTAVALSVGDEPEVLTAGVGGFVARHDLRSGRSLGTLMSGSAEIRSIRVLATPDRTVVATVAVDGWVCLTDATTGDEVATANVADSRSGDAPSLLTPTCLDAVVVPDGVLVVVGCASGHLFRGTWTSDMGLSLEEVVTPGVPLSGVNDVRIDGAGVGDRLYVARNDGVWLRVDPGDPTPVKVFTGHVGPVMCIAVTRPQGSTEVPVITGGAEGTVRIWRHTEEVRESLGFLRLNRHRGPVRSIQVRAREGGFDLVTGGSDGDVRLWPASHPDRSEVLSHQDGCVVGCLALSTPEGESLVWGATLGSLRLTRPDARAERPRLLGIAHDGITTLVGGTGDGYFWSGGIDGAVTRWDIAAGVARGTTGVADPGAVSAMGALRGLLYVGTQDGALTLLDATTLEVVGRRTFESAVTALATVEELEVIALGFGSGEVGILSVDRGPGAGLRPLQSHESRVIGLCNLELYGQPAIVSVGQDRQLKVVDVGSRTLVAEITLEGFPTALHTHEAYVGVATTAGATLFEFANNHHSSRT